MPRGGSRPGSGRKPKADKHEAKVAAAEKKAADHLPRCVDNLIALADGGMVTLERRYAPAGTVKVKLPLRHPTGEPILSERGKPILAEQLAFPDLDPLAMVEVARVENRLAPDRASNQYLWDRVAGRPTERRELSGPEGGAIPLSVEQAIDKIYGDAKEPAEAPR